MRKALIVGIDHYEHIGPLSGCVNDAHVVKGVLERHADGTVNFATPRLLTGTGPADLVARAELKEVVRELFAGDAEIALFYFAGHGFIEDTGGFTTLFVDALGGAAANLIGDVTPGSVYAHIDQSLGPWAQRPVFKTNVKTFVSLRKAAAPIPFADLQALTTYFPQPGFQFTLDPSYEPERSEEQKKDPQIPRPDPAKTLVFAILQRFVKVNLVRPVGAPHMWHAAMQSKSCELTVLGEHYRGLVAKGLL